MRRIEGNIASNGRCPNQAIGAGPAETGSSWRVSANRADMDRVRVGFGASVGNARREGTNCPGLGLINSDERARVAQTSSWLPEA
jgi:hypothetical protein